MYRPQFPLPPAPDGFAWQPCIFQFDRTNTPALGRLTLGTGQVSGYIPLKLDDDAPFTLLAVRISNAGVSLMLFDPFTNELMEDFVDPRLYASNTVPVTPLEGPGIDVRAGAVFTVRLQGE
jgi:hypothetical protein